MIVAFCAVVGLLFGSFANVLISRVPSGGDAVHGRSACPACGHEIRWFDNVPLASWVVLRGRCRDCKAPISPLYPVVEISGAVLGALSALALGFQSVLVLVVLMIPASLALVVIDLKHRRLPHVIVLPMLALAAIGAAVVGFTGGGAAVLVRALVGVAALGGFYGLLWLLVPRGMGFGDVTTASLIGLVAGTLGWKELAAAGILGPIVGGVAVLALAVAGRVRKGGSIPYGPALIAAGWLGWLLGGPISDTYLRLVGVG